MKSLCWMGSSARDVAGFPPAVKREVGYQLHLVQSGIEPSDWKPMPTVGAGANEIRIKEGGQWRVIYVAKFGEAVYVLHAFGKKTQRTTKADIALASDRYRDVLARRSQKMKGE